MNVRRSGQRFRAFLKSEATDSRLMELWTPDCAIVLYMTYRRQIAEITVATYAVTSRDITSPLARSF